MSNVNNYLTVVAASDFDISDYDTHRGPDEPPPERPADPGLPVHNLSGKRYRALWIFTFDERSQDSVNEAVSAADSKAREVRARARLAGGDVRVRITAYAPVPGQSYTLVGEGFPSLEAA